VAADDLEVRLDAARAEDVERVDGLGQQPGRLEQSVEHDRLVDVELEVALRAGEGDGRVVAEHTHRHLRERLRLGGVDLAGHDRRAGLVLGEAQLADAGARAGGVPAHVVGDLHERAGERAQRRARVHDRVVRRERGEEVAGGAERPAGQAADVGRRHLGEARVGVESGADRGAAQRQLVQALERGAHGGRRLVELGRPAGEHLSQRDRRRVLEMCASRHDHAGVLPGLGDERVAQPLDGRHERILELGDGGDVHHRGEGVVARLAQVDVVVGVDRGAGPAARPGQLVGPVGDHLVGVHVALRAAAGLEHDQRELRVEGALHDLAGGADDQPGFIVRQAAELLVGLCRRELEHAERPDHAPAPAEPVGPDGEVLDRPLRLRAPVVPGGDAHLAHAVVLDAPLSVHVYNTTLFARAPIRTVGRTTARE